MQSSVRALGVAAAVSVLFTTSAAVVVSAAPTSVPPRVIPGPTADTGGTTRARPSLPPVRTSAVDPAVLDAAPPSTSGAVVQTVQLSVVGGELTTHPDIVTVQLRRAHRSSRVWTGTVPPVRVVDARGTHGGWRVSWSVASVDADPRSLVWLDPSEPTVIAGEPAGVRAGHRSPSRASDRTLVSARPGGGGGTYEVGGTLAMVVPGGAGATSPTITLTFAISG